MNSDPKHIKDNLSKHIVLRPYQEEVLKYFLCYESRDKLRSSTSHLLLKMLVCRDERHQIFDAKVFNFNFARRTAVAFVFHSQDLIPFHDTQTIDSTGDPALVRIVGQVDIPAQGNLVAPVGIEHKAVFFRCHHAFEGFENFGTSLRIKLHLQAPGNGIGNTRICAFSITWR